VSQPEKNVVMLIVEDQELMRGLLREFVQSGYPDAAILEAAYGAQALEVCSGHAPQLVLMDVALPDANGIDVAAQIKQLLPQSVVVMVSQHAADVYVERARAAGAFAYIRKDRVYRELLPTIERALAGAPAQNGHGRTQ
jgi:DNA-binding NarL/FixJ family response regulator